MASVATSRQRPRPDKALGQEEWIARRLNGVILAIRNGDEDDVRALIDQIIDWAPDATAPIELAAEFAARNRDWVNLVRYRAALAAARPEDRRFKTALIRALALAKATRAALDMVDRLLEQEPTGAGFRRLRLEVLLAVGAHEAAAELCQVLAEAPGDETVGFKIDVAKILARYEEFSVASDWVARARMLHGDTPALTQLAATLDARDASWSDAAYLPEDSEDMTVQTSGEQGPHSDDDLSRGVWIDRRLNKVMLAIRNGGAGDVRALIDEIIDRAPEATAPIEMAAEFAARNEDWTNLVHYRQALADARPADRPAKVALVRAMTRAGATSAALDLVDRLLQEEPVGAGYRRLRLELLLADGRFEEVASLSAALMNTPADETPTFISDVAQILAQAQDYAGAREWVEFGQARHPRDPVLVRLAATIAYRERRWDQAERLWRELGESGNESLKRTARVFRARIAMGDGRTADATVQYAAAFDDDPANEEAARHLVRQAMTEGRREEAASVLGRLESRVGRTALVVGLRARLAVAGGDSRAALAEYRQGLANHPKDVHLRRDLADLHGNLGDYEAMDSVLSAAETLAPRDAAILSRRLIAGIARQLPPDQLLAIADRLLAVKPADQAVLRQKANLLIRLGERREALAVLITAIDVNPTNVSAWTAAISNMLILNDPQQAAVFVDRARATFSDETAPNLVSMAEILESADRGEEAVDHAERAVVLDPASGATRLIAARLWESRGLYRRAWPHLLALQDLDVGPVRGALTFARAARALHYVDARPVAGAESDRFPDAIFDRMSRSAVRRQFDEAAPLVLHVTSSLAAGGSERQVALTVQGLAATQDALRPELAVQDLNALTGRDFFLPAVQASGVAVSILAEMRGEGAVRELVALFAGQRPEISLLSALPTEVANVALPLYALILERRPRAVHLWQDAIIVAGGIAAMLAGVPHIVLATRSTRPIERQRARPYLKAGYHALLRYPGTTMLNNSLNGARDYADWLGIDADRIQTLYNGFVFDELRARADPALTGKIRAQLGAGREDVIIGGVMRCSFEKRPDLWTDAVIALAKSDPHIRGLLVGEGPMRAELQARVEAQDLAGRIQFVGRQSPIEPWMRAMDILFLSSLTEGLPNVLIEAQALGVAVATMRVGGAPETLRENETGLVIDEGPVADIAAAMAPLTLDAGMRRRFGAAGVAWTEATFSLDAAVARLRDIYSEH
jgi:glycosyltransferase involved in cell wall biosynthesis/thioredoxin-like negative regulator of GroEL